MISSPRQGFQRKKKIKHQVAKIFQPNYCKNSPLLVTKYRLRTKKFHRSLKKKIITKSLKLDRLKKTIKI